jgi:hypothetical protein
MLTGASAANSEPAAKRKAINVLYIAFTSLAGINARDPPAHKVLKASTAVGGPITAHENLPVTAGN